MKDTRGQNSHATDSLNRQCFHLTTPSRTQVHTKIFSQLAVDLQRYSQICLAVDTVESNFVAVSLAPQSQSRKTLPLSLDVREFMSDIITPFHPIIEL
jgi:hypothetical protein